MDHSLEEEEDEGDGVVSLMPAEVTKSGRVRKKSAKVLEMEEAEELEKQHLRRPEKQAKVSAAKRNRPRPPEGVAMAVTSAPVLEPGLIPGQGHNPQMRFLLTTGSSPPPAKKQKTTSPKMMGSDIPVLAVNPVASISAPPPPSSQEALKLKLQLGTAAAAESKSPKKAKAKKAENLPAVLSVPPPAASMVDIDMEGGDPGLKLKLVLSPKDKSPVTLPSSNSDVPKSSKKSSKKMKERSGDPESILQVQQNLAANLMPDDKSEKSKKKKKKKELEKESIVEVAEEKPKIGSPSKPDLQTASLHLLAALSQATQAIPKNQAQLAASRSPPADQDIVYASPPTDSGQVMLFPSSDAASVAAAPTLASTLASMPSPTPFVKQEEGGEEEVALVIDTVSSKSAKKKKTKKSKIKEEPQESQGDVCGADHVPAASPDHPVYADANVMAMKLQTFAEKKAKKTKKEKDPDKPKKKRKRGYTAYMLWCNSYRPRVVDQNPGIDFATISRRLGEIWQALPEKEKMSWKRKAKKLNAKGSTLISTGKGGSKVAPTAAMPATLAKPGGTGGTVRAALAARASTSAALKVQSPTDEIYLGMPGVSPMDVAAHLKLLGESLSIIGARLQEHQGLIAVQGSLSVLLDSMLCALAPLTCLTTQVPEVDGCPGATHSKTLDNVAYIMPGIG